MADRDVTVDILANDKTARATRAAAKNFEQVKKKVDESTKSVDKNSKAWGTVSKALGKVLPVIGKVTARVSAFVSLLGPAAVGLLKAAKGAVAFGKGLAGLAPAAAALPELLGSLGLLVGFGKLVAPAFVAALAPIKAAFVDADGNATKFTRHIQDLATRGVEPLAKKLVKLDLPIVGKSFERIATAVNGVVLGVGKWLLTTDGQKVITDIATSTADAMEKLAPHVTAASIALGNLAAKAGNPAIKGLTDLIGRLLDKFTAWANNTTVSDIHDSLQKLVDLKDKVKEFWDKASAMFQWMVDHTDDLKKFSDTLATLGLVVGVFTGDWPAVIVGAFTLVSNHWESVKQTFAGAPGWWSGIWQKLASDPQVQTFLTSVQGLVDTIKSHWEQLKQQYDEKLKPAFDDLYQKLHEKLLPALTDLINALGPWVDFMIKYGLPQLINLLTAVTTILTGVVTVVSGVIEIIAGIMSGLGGWGKIWKGAGEIVGGFAGIFVGWFKFVYANASNYISAIKGLWDDYKKWFESLFNKAHFFPLGQGIVSGIVNGILSKAGALSHAISSLLSSAKEAIPSALRGALGFKLNLAGMDWYPTQLAATAAGPAFAAASGGGFAAGTSGGRWLVENNNTVTVKIGDEPIRAVARSEADAVVTRYDRDRRYGKRDGSQ